MNGQVLVYSLKCLDSSPFACTVANDHSCKVATIYAAGDNMSFGKTMFTGYIACLAMNDNSRCFHEFRES